MYHNSKLSKFAFRTKIGLKWPFFAQTIPFFVFCFITNIYIWYIVGSGISRSERLQYFQIHKRYVTFLIMLFVYFSCQGRSFMLTARGQSSNFRHFDKILDFDPLKNLEKSKFQKFPHVFVWPWYLPIWTNLAKSDL